MPTDQKSAVRTKAAETEVLVHPTCTAQRILPVTHGQTCDRQHEKNWISYPLDQPKHTGGDGGQGRDRTGDLPLFRRTLIPTELPGRKAPVTTPKRLAKLATLTGLEPATSAVTGRRANQLRHRALLCCCAPRFRVASTPYGIRTRATALKGRRPRPLDEGGQPNLSGVLTTL